MATQVVPGNNRRAGEASVPARSLLRSKVAELSEAECGEVFEYIEVVQSLRREAAGADGERQAAAVGPHQPLQEPF